MTIYKVYESFKERWFLNECRRLKSDFENVLEEKWDILISENDLL